MLSSVQGWDSVFGKPLYNCKSRLEIRGVNVLFVDEFEYFLVDDVEVGTSKFSQQLILEFSEDLLSFLFFRH